MRCTRTFALGLAVAALAITPATALAKHGADDGPLHATDDHGATVEPGDDNGGAPEAGDDNGGRRDGSTRTVKRATGSCTGDSSAKLKAKHDDGRLEAEFEVDQNRNGVSWTVRIRRNGKSVVKTKVRTKAPSGSFSVERRIGDPAGSDRIVAKATSPSGEVCKASLTI
jgi:hypothetical protein